MSAKKNHKKNNSSFTMAKKNSVGTAHEDDLENVEQAVSQFGIIYNRELTAVSR
jgi:hypothetical protein